MSVKAKLVPAVGVAVAVAMVSVLAAAAFTVRLAVMLNPLTASEAVNDCGPALISVAEKVPWPAVSVELGGSSTAGDVSVLLKWTVPA